MTDGPPTVRAFWPHAEAQVAFGRPGHVPARSVVRIAHDLELVLAQAGSSDDLMLVRAPVSLAHLAGLRRAGLAAPQCLVAELDHHVLPRRHPLRGTSARAEPWAWTPDSCGFFAPLNRPAAPVPTWTASRARFWSKAWAAELLGEFAAAGLPVAADDVPRAIGSVAELERDALPRLARAGVETAVCKAAFASSGRGAIRLACRDHRWSISERRWLERLLRQQTELVIAPWRQRVADFSVQIDTALAEPLVGLVGLLCDARGRYRGNLVHRPEMPSETVGATITETMAATAKLVAARLRAMGHVGPAGIDAMLYRTADGRVRLQPLLEINPRLTMGRVALGLRGRVAARCHGALRVFGPRDHRALSPAQRAAKMAQELPLELAADGRISRGAVALNDADAAHGSLAMLIVTASAAELERWLR